MDKVFLASCALWLFFFAAALAEFFHNSVPPHPRYPEPPGEALMTTAERQSQAAVISILRTTGATSTWGMPMWTATTGSAGTVCTIGTER